MRLGSNETDYYVGSASDPQRVDGDPAVEGRLAGDGPRPAEAQR
jgi:hypothetical protein